MTTAHIRPESTPPQRPDDHNSPEKTLHNLPNPSKLFRDQPPKTTPTR